jgi:hypothetical protein
MSYGLRSVYFCCREQHCSRKKARLRCAVCALIAFGLLLFTACGGSSMPGASPANIPSTVLAVSTTLPAGAVGAAYNTQLKVTGGTAPYKFSMTSGDLPAGVNLADSTGDISGTPTAAGNFSFAVSAFDAKGNSKEQPLQMTVAESSNSTNGGGSNGGTSGGTNSSGSGSGSSTTTPSTSSNGGNNGGNSFSNLQHSGDWGQYGQQGPSYVDCSPSPCNGISFWMAQDVTSPSLSGQASEFNVGGSAPFSDALWNNHLIGPSSSQGLFDNNGAIVPSLHNFTYDVYFYGDNLGLSQALEFDINQFFGNMGFIFGHECRIASGNEWDVWDAQNSHWVPTGVPCNPNSNSWNHLTLKVWRTSDNHIVYQSITLNGNTANLGWTFGHGSVPGWYGLTINYQMDGDSRQDSYNTYLDQLTFSYQ